MDYRFYSLIALIFWGLWSYFSKILSRNISTEYLAFFTSIGAWLTIIILYLPKTKIFFTINILWAMLVGVSGAIGTVAFYYALAKGPASSVVPLSGLYIVIPVILGYIFLSEPITLSRIIGVVSAIIAIFLLSR